MSAIAIVFLSFRTAPAIATGDKFNPNATSKMIPPCLQMHYCIEKYAEEYDVPKQYAYGIAKQETEYRGPFQWSYNQSRISPVGALGAMQIMPSTAKLMWPRRKVTREMLLNDIDFNVQTSMKIIRHLYNTYGSWKLAFGAYNTGRPMVNGYAINVFNHQP